MTEQSPIVSVGGKIPFQAAYNWSVGILMEKFIKSLADKKLMAAKCPACGYTYVPPRNRCGKCNAEITESDLVELSGKGELQSYTLGMVKLDGAGNFEDLPAPQAIGSVKLEGADSTLFMPLHNVDVEKLDPGMKLEIIWNDELKGHPTDIKGFKPAK